MILDSLKYIREEGKPNQWSVEGKNGDLVRFDNINLFVGKNSVGKSRSLSALCEVANLLSLKSSIADIQFPDSKYHLILKEDNITYEYILSIENRLITEEVLFVKGKERYNRKKNIIYSQASGSFDKLDISDTDIITSIQGKDLEYPYLPEIFEWSNALKNYAFTNQYEKNHLIKNSEELDNSKSVEDFAPDNVIKLFSKGKQSFGQSFVDTIIDDLHDIGYDVKSIDLLKNKVGTGISVHEEELAEPTLQLDMSQGMFRALSFLIQLEFALLSKISVCLLIDDLGEGLDYHRSKALIDILIYKVNNSDIQIFITSNDRYIMNKIPLRYWSVIERRRNVSIFHNYHNAREIFDDFKYTGLNNFDFLATDFYLHGFKDEKEE